MADEYTCQHCGNPMVVSSEKEYDGKVRLLKCHSCGYMKLLSDGKVTQEWLPDSH